MGFLQPCPEALGDRADPGSLGMPQANQLKIANTEHPTSDCIPHKGRLLLKPGLCLF